MRKRLLIALPAVVLLAIAAAFYLHARSAPYTARILPEAYAIVFFNIAPVRTATHFDRDPITRSPDFQHFIDATGIVPERDLDTAAFALSSMPNPNGPNGPVAFSEILTGRFDPVRLSKYLASLSTSQEIYLGHTIYAIPSDGRTFRITQLDTTTIAASNAPTPEQIHTILNRYQDRSRAIFPDSGPTMLAAHYSEIPTFASAWALGRIGLPFSENNRVTIAGLGLPMSADTDFIASLRFTTTLHLRVEQLTPSPADAAQSAQALTGLLTLFRTLQPVPARTASDRDLRDLTNTIHIDQQGSRTILTADPSLDLLKRLAHSH